MEKRWMVETRWLDFCKWMGSHDYGSRFLWHIFVLLFNRHKTESVKWNLFTSCLGPCAYKLNLSQIPSAQPENYYECPNTIFFSDEAYFWLKDIVKQQKNNSQEATGTLRGIFRIKGLIRPCFFLVMLQLMRIVINWWRWDCVVSGLVYLC